MHARPLPILTVGAVLAALFLLLVPALPAQAAPAAQEAGAENPFLILFPEARRMAAPDWLRPGLRVTYYGASATTGTGSEGSAGEGYTQYDVVALDRRNVVSSARLFLLAGSEAPVPTMVMTSVNVPGAGDYWLHPALLVNAERVANDNLAVLRVPYEFDGQEVAAVRFQSQVNDLSTVWVFEETTGILLFYSHATGEAGELGRNLANSTLVSMRQMTLPWQGRAAPDWVEQGGVLRYEGSYGVDVGGGAVPVALSLSAEFTRVQPTWSVSEIYNSLALVPSTQPTGVAQLFNGFWLPRAALSARVRRPVLDRDPVTGSELRYEKVQGGGVLLTEGNASYTAAMLYDADGRLVAMQQQMAQGAAVTTIQLQLVE